LFTFILILILCAFCFIIYQYFSNKIIMYKKQIILLTYENDKLKTKLRKLSESKTFSNDEDKDIYDIDSNQE